MIRSYDYCFVPWGRQLSIPEKKKNDLEMEPNIKKSKSVTMLKQTGFYDWMFLRHADTKSCLKSLAYPTEKQTRDLFSLALLQSMLFLVKKIAVILSWISTPWSDIHDLSTYRWQLLHVQIIINSPTPCFQSIRKIYIIRGGRINCSSTLNYLLWKISRPFLIVQSNAHSLL